MIDTKVFQKSSHRGIVKEASETCGILDEEKEHDVRNNEVDRIYLNLQFNPKS